MDLKAYDVYRFYERLEFMSIVIRELAKVSHMEIEIWNNCFKISVVPNNTISNIMVLRVKRNDPVSEYLKRSITKLAAKVKKNGINNR